MVPQRRQHPTDRGWAWVVLVATMGSHLLNGAFTYFVGVVHTGLLNKFQPDTVTFLALTGAVCSALACMAAPVASSIINRFGCRTCSVLGGLLSFVGYTASAFVTTTLQLFFTYGLCTGLGLGLVYTSACVTIGFYFDKLRGPAAGISNSFQAVGILIGPLVYQAILEEYDVSGAFLLLGATSLHFCFFGMFYRPTIYEGKTMEVEIKEPDKENTCMQLKVFDIIDETSAVSPEQTVTEDDSKPTCDRPSKVNRTSLSEQSEDIQSRPLWMSPSACETGNVVTDDKMAKATVAKDEMFADAMNILEIDIAEENICSNETVGECDSDCQAPLLKDDDVNNLTNDNKWRDDVMHESEFAGPKPMCPVPNDVNDCILDSTPDDSSHQHYYREDFRDRFSDSAAGDTSLSRSHSKSKQCACPTLQNAPQDGKGKSEMTLLRRLRSSPYVQILDKAFLLHCAALFVSNIHISGVFLHLPEYAKLYGTGPIQRAELFVAVGALSLISKLASGFATSDPRIDPLILSLGLMGLNGLATCFFPLYADTFIKQMVFSSLFGLYFGGLYALTTPLAVRFVSVNRLSHAYGISVFVQGVGCIVGPIVAAMIVDTGGTYSHSFIFLGLMMLLGSFFEMGAACFLASKQGV